MKYQAYIDGLRGLAVTLVLLYHAELAFPGGFVGVDVFFVISGYLITSIILKEADEGRFSLANFWSRRIRRLLPACSALLICVALAGYFLLLPEEYQDLGAMTAAQPLLMVNFYLWRTLTFGYFGPAASNHPLLHTWSLAVEEQFYVLFPLSIMALERLGLRNWLKPLLVLATFSSLALSCWMTPIKPVAAYFLLPARAFEILLGGLVSRLKVYPRGLVAESLSWTGLGLILGGALNLTKDSVFPGAWATLPTVGTALIIWANSRFTTTPGRLFSLSPAVFVGKISYSLYLWHWPIIAFLSYNLMNSPTTSVFEVMASVLAGILSWNYVERPFRERNLLPNNRSVFLFFACNAAFSILLGSYIFFGNGLPRRMPAQAVAYANAERDWGDFRWENTPLHVKQNKLRHFGDLAQPPTLFLWGDSHGMACLPMLDHLCRENHRCGEAATRSASPPVVLAESLSTSPQLNDWTESVLARIQNVKPRLIILVYRWDLYIELPGFADALNLTLEQLRKQRDCQIVLVCQVPRHPLPVARAQALKFWHGWTNLDFRVKPDDLGRRRRNFQTLLEKLDLTRVTVIDPGEVLVGSQGCLVDWQGISLYRDQDHLSAHGAEILRPQFEAALKQLW